MAYLFDPAVLNEIVRAHVTAPVEQQMEAVSRTLREVYGAHVSPGQPWMFSNAGGIMCAINPLHVSWNEYLLFCGTAIGSEGHSGRHRADMYDVVMAGELWTYQAGGLGRTVHRAGDLAHLPRGTSNGSRLRPGVWMLEYARGNIASLFPFALGDTIFSTLDVTDLGRQLTVSTKLMAREAITWLDERRRGIAFKPNLAALRPAKPPNGPVKGQRRRLDLN